MKHSDEIKSGERFAFGKNWQRFLSVLDETRIREAENSLRHLFDVTDLAGKSFLDIGSGSGLFSLAARRLGARVHSFDYDPQSVACTRALKERFFVNDPDWVIEEGSVLDPSYVARLGQFDYVYSWGVLHHTGQMWQALENAHHAVKDGGRLSIALYNDQSWTSVYWRWVKIAYNKAPITRPVLILAHGIYPILPSVILKCLKGEKYPRGMNPWYDLLDWLGGYPFEVSTPEQIFNFYKDRGYTLRVLKTVGARLGCNEYTFERDQQRA